jgi:hypothetical protein
MWSGSMRARFLLLAVLIVTLVTPLAIVEASPSALPGVTVKAWDDSNSDGVVGTVSDSLQGTDTTDSNGDFSFTSVMLSDDTMVVFALPPAWGPEEYVAGTIGASTNYAGATVEAWEDTNSDGIVGTGSDTLLASTTTDSNGDFSFENEDLEDDTMLVLSMPPAWGPEESVWGTIVTP